MWFAVEDLGGKVSTEAEIALRIGRTAELGCGLSANWASSESGEDLGAG